MPCENCSTQFNIFKRKRACLSCQRLYCSNCLGKKIKYCQRCETVLSSKKINISGIVEKEELANLIINHVNSNNYYNNDPTGSHSSTSTTPNHDFENYAQSFDQIKQTCQNLFTSISDKISSDIQKTTCFHQPNQPGRAPTTQQPRPSNPMSPQFPAPGPPPQVPAPSAPPVTPRTQDQSMSSNIPSSSRGQGSSDNPQTVHGDCDCSDCDDEIDEISEKRQSIFDGNPGPSGFQSQPKIVNSSSSDSSSFEEVGASTAKLNDDNWEVIEKTASNGIRTVNAPRTSQNENLNTMSTIPPTSPGIHRITIPPTRRRSDSSLLSLRKSNSIIIDTSMFDPNQSASEVKKLKISCNKCGKAKSNIKREILRLSEQLKASHKSEAEVNAKIKEFLDYLESRSQHSEMTETDDSQARSNPNEDNLEGARFIASSTSEIAENVFDENEGINVYPSNEDEDTLMETSTSTPRRFIQLDDIQKSDDLDSLSVKQLKEILMLNRVDFKGCCEKQELKERVKRLWQDHVSALPSEKLPTDDLCKICMDAPIECVFLECGHMATCTNCGKVLNECPICRQFIVRVVRTFKS